MQVKELFMNANTLLTKTADTLHDIHDLLKQRWSPRAFSSTPIPAHALKKLFEAARWSPSASNIQPWAFVIATQQEPEAFSRVAGLLNPNNARWAAKSPVLVIAILNKKNPAGAPNDWAAYDLGQAVAHLSVQAEALGLSVHQMGGFDRTRAQEELGLPTDYEALTAIAIGYQGELADLPEDLQTRETAARTRKPQSEFVFNGTWNNPLN
jgi:nitroreductase